MEYLVEGVVDLYFYRNLRGDHYLLGKRNLPIKEISFPDEIIEKEGIPFKRNILVNTYVIKFYLQDCPEIFADIDKLTNPKHKILIQLIKKYHDIYCPDNVCLIYQKKMPKFRVDIQPIIGITNVNYSIVFDIYNKVNAFSLQYGVLTYFWLPLDNEKLFLKTGIIYNQVKGYYYSSLIHNSFEIRGVKIPLQVNYNLLKTGITPVMSAGLNIYSTTSIPFAVVPAIGVGINAKITDRLYATLSSELDFLTTPINLVQIISHSFNLGLAVKL